MDNVITIGKRLIPIAHSDDLDQLFQRISIKRSGRTRSVCAGA